jgi:uncharacterized protein YfaS (alpha-2-macroglobulin family)
MNPGAALWGWLKRAYATPVAASLLAFLLVVLATGCHRQHDVVQGVELIPGTTAPEPGTTFQIRFPESMVSAEVIGLPSAHPPVTIDPPVRGTFVWRSTRSGSFTPEEPFQMDRRYTITLNRGITKADGTPLKAKLRYTFLTPPLTLLGSFPRQGSTNASSTPEFKLLFNGDLAARDLSRFFEFRDRSGRRVQGIARRGTLAERPYQYEWGTPMLESWQKRFPSQPGAPAQTGAPSDPDAQDESTNPVPNLVIVTPQHPLPLGKGWRLKVERGLPGTDGALSLPKSVYLDVGDVIPFELESAWAEHVIHSAPSISLSFSKSLSKQYTNTIANWIKVSPAVTNLQAFVNDDSIVLRGPFQSGTEYSLKVRAGLAAEEPFQLEKPAEATLLVPPVAPRLYFPSFSKDQLAGGLRQLPLQSVNVDRIRIRAKLLEAPTAVHALRGYQNYRRPYDEREDWNEPFQKIDFNLVPGRTVFSKELQFTNAPDEAVTTMLDWNEILGERKRGVVFISAERVSSRPSDFPSLGTQTIIQLTDLGIIWKCGPEQVSASVFSHSKGTPVAGATARLLSNENEVLSEAKTDSNGTARLAGHTNAQWIAVQQGDDLHVLDLENHQLPMYHYGLNFSYDSDDDRRVLIFSDRDLYRPGETAHLQIIARDWTTDGLKTPVDLSGRLEAIDARWRSFFQSNITFGAEGSWSGDLPLAAEVRGDYQLIFRTGERSFTYDFRVADFEPNAFEIGLDCPAAFNPGESIELPVSARYYFGKPLSGARIKWTLESSDAPLNPPAFSAFRFHYSASEERSRSSATIAESGEGLLNDTNLIIRPRFTTNQKVPQPRSGSLLVEITDLNQQTVTRRADFLQHSSDFYLGLRTSRDVLYAGEELPLEAVAVDPSGTPWPHDVTASLKLVQIQWQTLRIQGAGGTTRYRNEPILTNVLERTITIAPAQLISTNNPGKWQATAIPGLVATSAGDYRLEIASTDAKGNPVLASTEFSVSAADAVSWNYRNDVRLELQPDRDRYQAGQTAKILVESPFTGPALVTLERECVLRSFWTRLEGNAPVVEIPLSSNEVPNVVVSITLVRGADACPRTIKEPDYRAGFVSLLVDDPSKHLQVEVSCQETNYLPGASINARARIMDWSGQSVSNAWVTVYAVDEGITSLTGHQIPDPLQFVYSPRPLRVTSSISLPNLLSEDPSDLEFHNKGFFGGGGGEPSKIRRDFLACAFWRANLLTDAKGEVAVGFTAPDSITRYRLVAVAQANSDRFGAGKTAFQVSKPLLLTPALPQFAHETDLIRARAVVQNQTDQAGEVLVSLELDPSALSDGTSERKLNSRIQVPARGSAVCEFPVRFVSVGESAWTWRTRFADEERGSSFTDAVESTISVSHIRPLLREVLNERPETGVNLLRKADPWLLEGNGTVTVKLSNTRLLEVAESAHKLLHYPYGCAEQTSSSLLPWIVASNLTSSSSTDPGAIILTNLSRARAVAKGISRLFDMQTSSGGISYWPGEPQPMPWASAYAGLVLTLANQGGFSVPASELQQLYAYLAKTLRDNDDADFACLALYVLAQASRAEPAYHEQWFNRRANLSAENRALLALAVHTSGGLGSTVSELLSNSPSQRSPDSIGFGSAARTRAILLLARIECAPDAGEVDQLLTELLQERVEGDWGTTQGNAWAMLSLSRYADRFESEAKHISGHLKIAGALIPFELGESNHVFTFAQSFSNSAPTAFVTLNGNQTGLFSTTAVASRPSHPPREKVAQGFRLRRTYQKLGDQQELLGQKDLQAGDRVLVTLEIDVLESTRYVAVDDPLPAVLEIVNPTFRTQQIRAADQAMLEKGTDRWPGSFQEARKDRMLFFANWVEPGTYQLSYLARVRAAGTATAPAAKIEAMYQPARFALSEPAVIEAASARK